LPHALQRFHGSFGAQLGKKTDRRVNRDHGPDRYTFHPVAEQKRDAGRDDQQKDDQALKLMVQDGPDARAPGFPKLIDAESVAPLFDFGIVKTLVG
jgi:hypothetical protein